MLLEDIEVSVYRSRIKLPVIFFVPSTLLVSVYVLLYLFVNSELFRVELQRGLTENLPGQFVVGELVVDPAFTEVHLFDSKILDVDGSEIIDARELHAGVDPLPLLVRRIRVDHAVARNSGFRMVRNDGQMNLLRALGLADDDDGAGDDEESPIASVSLSNLSTENCWYVFDMDFLDFEIPEVSIKEGHVDIARDKLLMRVPELEVARVDFEFQHWLFYYPEDKGNWRPSAYDLKLTNWTWAGDGFSVEKLSGVIERDIQVEVTGTMTFPDTAPEEDTKMLYRGHGKFKLPPWNRAGHYFVEDFFHADSRTIEIAVEGDLEGIEGAAEVEAAVLDAYGLQISELAGEVFLTDSVIVVPRVTGKIHGGDVTATDVYFDMFTGRFGGDGTFSGINPAGVVRDFGYDYPWLEGKTSGAVAAAGKIPFDEEYKPDTSPFVALDQYLDPIISVEFTRDTTFERTSRELLPGRRFTLRRGARLWSNEDRVAVEYAKVDAENVEATIRSMVFDWEEYRILHDQHGRIAHFDLQAPSMRALAADYDASGVDGRLDMSISAVGRVNYPDAEFRARVSNPRLLGEDFDFVGKTLVSGGRVREGRLELDSFSLDGDMGTAALAGWIKVLEDPRPLADEDGEIITDYLYPRRHPARLSFDASELDLEQLTKVFGLDLDVNGRGFARGQLSGTLEDPDATFAARGENVLLYGQPLERLELEADVGQQTIRVRDAILDAGHAGKVAGWANVGFDESLAFELTGERIDLSQLLPLQATGLELAGLGGFYLHGSGTVGEPQIGGDAQLDDLKAAGRDLGDLAVVVNTVGDTTHLVGALLPWVTVDVEVPLDGKSSYYARLGVDQLELADAVPELRRFRVIETAEATGTIELFAEHDFSRYQVLANLSELKVKSLGKVFQNRGPIVAGVNDGELFQIQQATIGTDNRFVSVQGGIFLDQELIDVTMEGDLDLSLLTGFRLSFPEYFPESFLESKGVITLDVAAKGTPGSIVADGFVEFGPTQVLLRDVSDPLVVLGGRVNFDRESVRIPAGSPLRGRLLGGVYSLSGGLQLDGFTPKNVEVDLWTHNMSYRLPEVANLTFDAKVALDVPDLERPDTWKVSGDVDILDGLYYETISIFQEQLTNRVVGAFSRRTQTYEASLVERFPALEEMTFDLALHARDGFRIQNEIDRLGLDLELRIDVRLQNTLPDPRVTGDVDVIAGRVAFQGEAFEVRSGTLSFFGNPDNPYVDIVADADVFNTCRETDVSAETAQTLSLSGVVDTGEQRVYHVVLNVRGPLDNLDVDFESNPFADQRDVLSLLLTGCTVDQLTASSASSPTLEVALGPVLGWIEGQVQDVVEVEEFTITPSVDRLKATVGDSISRRLSWKLQLDTGLTEAATGQRFQVEYRLSDRWSAEASESSSESSQFDSFLLDFKLKYRLLLD